MFKIFAIISLVLTLAITLSSLTSAEFWACFNEGEGINFCNPVIPDRRCSSTLCKFCMDSFNQTQRCYNQGNFNLCNSQGGECTFMEGVIDTEPPILTINNPKQNFIYNDRRILFDFRLDKESDVYYLDMINGRGRWIKICNKCISHSKTRSFKEGLTHIKFRAVDSSGNEIFKEVEFFIDSKKPRIFKTNPTSGFANGFFDLTFDEKNPKELIIHYGNAEKGFSNKNINLSSCNELRGKTICETNVSIGQYDGDLIEYWFSLKDIANSESISKKIKLKVDVSPPEINSINSIINGKIVLLSINISEQNIDRVEYFDNSDPRARWKTLCRRLKNDLCESKINLKTGNHNILIQATDKAGNTAGENININI